MVPFHHQKSPYLTLPDFIIGFSIVDLVEKQVRLVDLFLKCGVFQRLKSEK